MIPAAAPSIGQYTIHNNSLVFYGVDLSASDLCFPIGKCLVVWLGRLGAQSSESKGWLSSCDIAQVYELLLSHPISELSNLQCSLLRVKVQCRGKYKQLCLSERRGTQVKWSWGVSTEH